jgi:hypothetical protein
LVLVVGLARRTRSEIEMHELGSKGNKLSIRSGSGGEIAMCQAHKSTNNLGVEWSDPAGLLANRLIVEIMTEMQRLDLCHGLSEVGIF